MVARERAARGAPRAAGSRGEPPGRQVSQPLAESQTLAGDALNLCARADLAPHSRGCVGKVGSACCPQVGAALLLGKAIHFPKREVRPCYQGLLFGIAFFLGKSWGGKKLLET